MIFFDLSQRPVDRDIIKRKRRNLASTPVPATQVLFAACGKQALLHQVYPLQGVGLMLSFFETVLAISSALCLYFRL
jgi:hypothetical protein